jgi:hypothetical protein
LLENAIETVDAPLATNGVHDQRRKLASLWPLLCCAGVFLLCILLNISVFYTIAGVQTHFWLSTRLKWFGHWIPTDLSTGAHSRLTLNKTGFLEWMILLAGMFLAYGIGALYIHRQEKNGSYKYVMGLIWLGVLVASLLFLFTPAMMTTDAYSYASYGRLLAVYFVNPYFVPPSAFPHDVVYQWIYWKTTVSIYGPIWMVLCSLLSLIAGSSQMGIILVFRGFALLCHFANIALIVATLRTMKRSRREVLLGAFLYGWNPLVLMETGLSGHNDVVMILFILLGLYFCARAESKGTFLQWRGYIPPILAFTASALIKFSAAPVLAAFVLAPFFATVHADSHGKKFVWRRALTSAVIASVVCGVVAFALYLPFWIGHSVSQILYAFTSLPSATQALNSVLSTFSYLNNAHELPQILNILKSRKVWNIFNLLAMVLPVVAGAFYLWRAPTTRTIVLVTIASFSGFLLSSPWFFSWYLVWLVGLVPFCLPGKDDRMARALLAFSLTFSATCFLSYYTTLVGWMLVDLTPPVIVWSALQNIGILGIPLLMFFVAWRYSLADLKLLWQRIPVLNLSFVRSSSKEVKEV